MSAEERFVAVMRWARERDLANLVLGLREARQRLVEQAASRVAAASKPRGVTGLGALDTLLGNKARLANITKTMDLGTRNLGGIGGFDTARFGPPIARMASLGVSDHLRQADAIARITLPEREPSIMAGLTSGDALGLGKASELAKAIVGSRAVSEMVLPGARIAEWSASRGILGVGEASELSKAFATMGKMPEMPYSAARIAEWSASRGILGKRDVSELGKAFAGRGAISGMTPIAAQIAGWVGAESLPGLYGFEKLGATLDFTAMFPGAFSTDTALSKMLEGIGGFGLGAEIAGFRDQFRRSYESLVVVEYARVWAGHPLWFLLDFLNPAELPELVGRPREEVFDAVLDALEVVVRDSELTLALLAAVEKLPFLTDIQHQWLMYGLHLSSCGEWVQAVANLLLGFEGALHSGAVHAELINPSGEGKLLAAEAIIKRSELSAELQNFAIKLVFGGRGNAFRHGRPGDEARDQVLLILVALVGWIDVVLDAEGTQQLARQLHAPLRRVIEGEPSNAEAA